MRRNQLVFTPAGWGVIDSLLWVVTEDDEWAEWVALTLEERDGDADRPRLFRRAEIEFVLEEPASA